MTRFQRATQILRWLRTEFPLPENLRLELKDEITYGGDPCYGLTDQVNGKTVIYMSNKMNRTTSQMIETLIHEAAHAELFDKGLGIMHGDRFWKHFGRMMDAYEHHGKLDSLSFDKE